MSLLAGSPWSRLAYALALVVPLAAASVSCAQSCTEMGCVGSIAIHLEGLPVASSSALPLTVRACDGAKCTSVSIRAAGSVPSADLNCAANHTFECCYDDPVAFADCDASSGPSSLSLGVQPDPERAPNRRPITVTVTDATGKALVAATQTIDPEPFYPNGEECGGACYSGSVDVSIDPG